MKNGTVNQVGVPVENPVPNSDAPQLNRKARRAAESCKRRGLSEADTFVRVVKTYR